MKLIKSGLPAVIGKGMLLFSRGGTFRVLSTAYYPLPSTQELTVTTNKNVTSATAAGWSITINAVPVTGLAIDSVSGKDIVLTSLSFMGEGDTVIVSYDSGAGETESNGKPLEDYTGTAQAVIGQMVTESGDPIVAENGTDFIITEAA